MLREMTYLPTWPSESVAALGLWFTCFSLAQEGVEDIGDTMEVVSVS